MLPQDRIKLKYRYEEVYSQYKKLQIMVNLRAVKNVTFLRVILKKIKLSKELFLLDIEQG